MLRSSLIAVAKVSTRCTVSGYGAVRGVLLVKYNARGLAHSVKDHLVEKTPITSQLWQMRKQDIGADSATAKSTLTAATSPKTVEQTKLNVRYSFSTDHALRDLYMDHKGSVLVGRLFEDMDAIAGNVALKHCCDGDPNTKRPSLVTASVDEINQKNPIPISDDILLTGQVAWVGSSSLDVLVEVHRVDPDPTSKDTCLLSSIFTYVARDRDTMKAVTVNPLTLQSAEELALYDQRQHAAADRKAQRSNNHAITDAAVIETTQKLIERGTAMQDLPALAPANAVLMNRTGLENSVVCQPQHVNTAGKVFGGYIMHRAFDLALATSYIFAGTYPVFLEVDKIVFRKPVDIGDLLRLKSRVIYSDSTEDTSGVEAAAMPLVVVEVVCQVVRPERATSAVSNTFHFVFGVPQASASGNGTSVGAPAPVPARLRQVLPVNAEEARAMVVGRKATESSRTAV